MEIANSQGDIRGRMRQWEPCAFGPKYENAYNYEEWEKLEYSAPVVQKGVPHDGNLDITV